MDLQLLASSTIFMLLFTWTLVRRGFFQTLCKLPHLKRTTIKTILKEPLYLSQEIGPADGSGLEVRPGEIHQGRAQVLVSGVRVIRPALGEVSKESR